MKLVALAALALLWGVAAAFAHASLNATVPHDGAVVATAPSSFSMTFSEPVSPLSLTLIRPDGAKTPLDSFALRDRTLEIEAPAALGRGTHVLSWRVVSEDGHPVGGSVVFSIGAPSAQAPLAEESIDWTVRGGLWLSRIALYVGLFIGVGGVFARHIFMPGIAGTSRVTVAALLLGAAGAMLSLAFQGLDALGAPAGHIVEPIVWSTALGTSFGRTVIAALVAFAVAAIGLAADGIAAKAAASIALLCAGLALALSGHASAASPQWLMRPMVFLHATAIAVWIGALAPLGLALKRAAPGAARALARFSRAIPGIVAALIFTGIGLAIVQVEHTAALFDTAYGRVFLVKLVLLAGLFGLAAFNRWSLTASAGAGERPAARRLVRSIAVETLVAILVFGAAAAWRFTPPPRALAAAAALPESVHIHTARAMADIAITPGRAGPVDVSATIMTGDFGALNAKEVALVFSNPAAGIEPMRRQAFKPGDGTWRVDGLLLPAAGAWKVRVDILISDFEIVRLDGEITIRP